MIVYQARKKLDYQARKKLDVEKRDINAVVDGDSFLNGDSLSGKEEIRC